MTKSFQNNRRTGQSGRLLLYLSILAAFLLPQIARAHPSPNTLIFLDVSPGKVNAELQLPLPELELAFGHAITKDPEQVIAQYGPLLKEYLKAHIHPYVNRSQPWIVNITSLRMSKGTPIDNGPLYWEVIADLELLPQPGETTYQFQFDYDVIMHEVMNHVAFVSVRNDWENGRTDQPPVELGVISRDMKDNLIHPLPINLEKGNWWKGFKSMVTLGMNHIKEGTDHLLFLLVLLLPAMLTADGRRWSGAKNVRGSLTNLVRIITAFTIGHSVTLLLGALGWVHLPTQPVEILIALSILVSAIHAIRPLFPGKEGYIAAGFGLIHGLAFASVLYNLKLETGPMTISILGFNIGIELMQLFIIALIIPWILLLSKLPVYVFVRTGGAIFAAIASIAWITERITGETNMITLYIQQYAVYTPWLILALAIFSCIAFGFYRRRKSATAT